MTESSLRYKARRLGLIIRKSRQYGDCYAVIDAASNCILAGSPVTGDMYSLDFDDVVEWVNAYGASTDEQTAIA